MNTVQNVLGQLVARGFTQLVGFQAEVPGLRKELFDFFVGLSRGNFLENANIIKQSTVVLIRQLINEVPIGDQNEAVDSSWGLQHGIRTKERYLCRIGNDLQFRSEVWGVLERARLERGKCRPGRDNPQDFEVLKGLIEKVPL